MFPLGTVLFPHQSIDLQIFEPRYLTLLADCLEGDRTFGIVLIVRGSEVGGGDVRSDVGTVARIIAMGQLPGDRIGVRVTGESRIRVVRWLADDPYPRGEIVPVADPSPAVGEEPSDGPRAAELARAAAAVQRSRWLVSEMETSSTLPRDPTDGGTAANGRGPGDEVAAWRLCAAAPLGPFDRQALLAAPSWAERLDRLARLCDEVAADAATLLAQPGPDPGPGTDRS
jgi:uncharacterized protein